MKLIPLTIDFILVFLLFLIQDCTNEQCLDITELNRLSEIAQEWFINDSIGNHTIADKHGMNQTLRLVEKNLFLMDKVVSDDCGNSYGSFRLSFQYTTSLSPIHFLIAINGSGNKNDGFYLQLTASSTIDYKPVSTTYDFVSHTTRDNNSIIKSIDSLEISGKKYKGILEIIFNHDGVTDGVKSVYYAKGYGIIKFALNNGNVFEIRQQQS